MLITTIVMECKNSFIKNVEFDKRSLSVISYNCRGYSLVKNNYINNLLANCDILFLQEHWLADDQLVILGQLNRQFLSHAVCGFDNNEVLSGRPYGGCAILWRSDMLTRVEPVKTNSRRICAIRMSNNLWSILLINVYMPYEEGEGRCEDFCSQLSIIEYLISQNASSHIIIGGDFNVDFCRNWQHTELLTDFCDNLNLEPVNRHNNYHIDYTYNFNMSRFNILDHFILSGVLFDEAIISADALHDGDNLSDHDPIILKLCLDSKYVSLVERIHCDKIAWHKANDCHIAEYKLSLQSLLSCITIPVEAIACHDPLCKNVNHSLELNTYASAITDACITAANINIPHTGWAGGRKPIPGWTEHVEPVRNKSVFWHKIWIESGRPKTGVVADIMRRTRASYHYAIRCVKRDERSIVRQRFAAAIICNSQRDLWSEVRRMNGKHSAHASTIDGQSCPNSISRMFADKYEKLYNSVAYDTLEMDAIRQVVDERVSLAGYTDDCMVTHADVTAAISLLKHNKNDGGRGLSTNHFKFACAEFATHTALLFSGLLTHGSVIDEFLLSTTVPIPKGRNVNLTDSENYRGITLSSVFGRLLDLIILNRYSDTLNSSELQFGFKRNRSTAMCSMIAKEVISYYTTCNSSVHCVFLDSSKAFDKVEYCKLFKLLLDRKIPPHVIRILLNMYTNQQIRVLWNGIYSYGFAVKNGVKQGAIVSPILFCVYLDVLLVELQAADVGCFISNRFAAALAYADDIILLAPSARAMRRMLYICDRFGEKYDVTFNNKKSKCINFTPLSKARSVTAPQPSFEIGGNMIENVDRWPHLGHIFSAHLTDNDDIMTRRNCFIGQANSFLCNFSMLDPQTRHMLFRLYCSSHYGCVLWQLSNSTIEEYCIAWRKCVRRIWSLPYNSSRLNVSLISDSLPVFDEICRRAMNFVFSCLNSDSELIRSVVLDGVNGSRINSPIGRNAAFCALRYKIPVHSIGVTKLSSHVLFERLKSAISTDQLDLANVLREAVLIRDGVLSLHDNRFHPDDFNYLISACVT